MTDKPYPKRPWMLWIRLYLVSLLIVELVCWLLLEVYGWWKSIFIVTAISLGTVLIGLTILLVRSLVHHRFQFSMRTLLLLVAILGVGFGLVGSQIKQARDHELAVRAIEAAGGHITFNYSFGTNLGIPAKAPWPQWLRSLVGDKYLARAIYVNLVDDRSIQAAIQHIGGLAHAEEIILNGHSITDEEFRHLKELKRLPKWNNLTLLNTKTSDAGLVQLQNIPHITGLCFNTAGIGDAGLVHLEQLGRLKVLKFANEVSQGTPNVITDAGLVYLKRLTKLEILVLHNIKITDAGILHLKSLSNLKILNLKNTMVTVEGVKKLQQALPNCEIEYSPQ